MGHTLSARTPFKASHGVLPTIRCVVLAVSLAALSACGLRQGLAECAIAEVGGNPQTWFAAVVSGLRPALYELSEHRPARRLTRGDDLMPSVSPSGRLVAFSRDAGQRMRSIWTLDLSTGREQRLTQALAYDDEPVCRQQPLLRSESPRRSGGAWAR